MQPYLEFNGVAFHRAEVAVLRVPAYHSSSHLQLTNRQPGHDSGNDDHPPKDCIEKQYPADPGDSGQHEKNDGPNNEDYAARFYHLSTCQLKRNWNRLQDFFDNLLRRRVSAGTQCDTMRHYEKRDSFYIFGDGVAPTLEGRPTLNRLLEQYRSAWAGASCY